MIWLGFAVTAGKPLVLWAEQVGAAKAGEPASLYAQPLVIEGAAAPAALITNKACVWQVASVGGQAGLATVKATNNACATGSVVLDLLGATGKSDKSVELGGRAALDLDLVASPDAFVLAWSDQSQLEPRAVTALVDAKGAVRAAPAGAVPALGEQAVVALSAGSSPRRQPSWFGRTWPSARKVRASSRCRRWTPPVGPALRARILYGRVDGGARSWCRMPAEWPRSRWRPRAIRSSLAKASCRCRPSSRWTPRSRCRASEPLVLDALGSGRAADLGWGLTCHERGCFALGRAEPQPGGTVHGAATLARESVSSRCRRSRRYRSRASSRARCCCAPRGALSSAPRHAQNRKLVGYVNTDFDPTTPWAKADQADGRRSLRAAARSASPCARSKRPLPLPAG